MHALDSVPAATRFDTYLLGSLPLRPLAIVRRFRDHSSIEKRGFGGWLRERRLGYAFRPGGGDGEGSFELEVLPGRSQWEQFSRQRKSEE